MRMKPNKNADKNGISLKQDVVRSVYPLKNTDTNDSRDAVSLFYFSRYADNNRLFVSYLMIFYVILYSIIMPPSNTGGSAIDSLFRILHNVFRLSFLVKNDNIWLLTTILFIFIICFCCLSSISSILKYYRERVSNNKYLILMALGVFSLILNMILLFFSLSILYLLVAGFRAML